MRYTYKYHSYILAYSICRSCVRFSLSHSVCGVRPCKRSFAQTHARANDFAYTSTTRREIVWPTTNIHRERERPNRYAAQVAFSVRLTSNGKSSKSRRWVVGAEAKTEDNKQKKNLYISVSLIGVPFKPLFLAFDTIFDFRTYFFFIFFFVDRSFWNSFHTLCFHFFVRVCNFYNFKINSTVFSTEKIRFNLCKNIYFTAENYKKKKNLNFFFKENLRRSNSKDKIRKLWHKKTERKDHQSALNDLAKCQSFSWIYLLDFYLAKAKKNSDYFPTSKTFQNDTFNSCKSVSVIKQILIAFATSKKV